jgi:hypothetical protein
MIHKVGKLIVGDEYMFDGVRCRIEIFLTRNMLWVHNKDRKPAKSGRWTNLKISIKEFLETARRLPGPNDPRIGQRVKMRDDEMTRAWGYQGQLGTVVGTDPDGDNCDVFQVKLDSGSSILEIKGVHRDHFEMVEKKK